MVNEGAIVIPLNDSPLSRLGDIVVALVCLAIGGYLGVIVVMAVLRVDDPDAVVWLGLFILALLTLGFLATAASSIKNIVRKGDRLVLRDDHLEIHNRGLLETPATIARDNIRRVVVEESNRRIGPFENAKAFPFPESTRTAKGFLFTSDGGSPLPLVGAGRDVPNVAVICDEPIVFSSARRFNRATASTGSFSSYRLHVQFPNPKDPVMGFMTRVKQPLEAHQAFTMWGLQPAAVTAEEAAWAFPPEAEYERRRRRGYVWLGWALVVGVIIRVIAETLT